VENQILKQVMYERKYSNPIDSELGGELDAETRIHNYPTNNGTKSRISSLAGCPVAPNSPVLQNEAKSEAQVDDLPQDLVKKLIQKRHLTK
jgi:hypothetical protein